ncbi:acyltransferase [Chitinophaga sp. XS-30]|uniref:acyltransferase family protein n=1 Tax=Chitinophaga sp. XS-30 TaxID=2604421 RepID=UPI0011DDE851|nr:acyltransferase [Chitinophaga sp. XS-30]QEH41141.1 acyltransferase [Chitinophaga sp. XS-30]
MKTKSLHQGTDWVNNLRSSITILVIAHHAALAYTTFASFDKTAYIRSTHAIVDVQRWKGLDVFVNFNDIFFMSLMFLIGGLFLSGSIDKKGPWRFIRDRFYRLFLPFFFGGTLLMLIAYFPSYYIAHNSLNVTDYIQDFFTVENWPVGPPWFIWVLFLFNLVFAVTYRFLHNFYTYLADKLNNVKKGIVLFLVFYLVTWILYVPLAHNVGAGTWTGVGPFDFQLSRLLLYFGYFMLGVILGIGRFNAHLFAAESGIARQWKTWVFFALLTFLFLTILTEYNILRDLVVSGKLKEFTAWMIYFSIYTASCVLSTIAFMTTYRKMVNSTGRIWTSLNHNAYLIYLIHFVFVTWLQFALLPVEAGASVKFMVVFVVSFFLSWGAAVLLRRVRFLGRFV